MLEDGGVESCGVRKDIEYSRVFKELLRKREESPKLFYSESMLKFFFPWDV